MIFNILGGVRRLGERILKWILSTFRKGIAKDYVFNNSKFGKNREVFPLPLRDLRASTCERVVPVERLKISVKLESVPAIWEESKSHFVFALSPSFWRNRQDYGPIIFSFRIWLHMWVVEKKPQDMLLIWRNKKIVLKTKSCK